MIGSFLNRRYTYGVKPFNFRTNKQRIQDEINSRIKIANLKDPQGFTLIEGIIVPGIKDELMDVVPLGGRIFPQVAIVGNSTGEVHYFYLDKLFPGEGLD